MIGYVAKFAPRQAAAASGARPLVHVRQASLQHHVDILIGK
ncbi:hypothetical protein CFter6_2601 [Collimonas fungivorans]|uniref:Uncharacterized protein n=1 Tax=Collimonas fungivorans TaxID=158899 RepID=A0A127PCT9_9BURK|nr:hypothetical protein CFter6_2601 [Collimonas fungivorans]